MRMIVAVDDRWGIGKNGDLLKSIPEDMQYYRATTRGRVVLMGYATLISLPGSKPQPGRLNFVLADVPGLRVPGAVVCDSMDMLLSMAAGFEPDDVFVIGGGSVYRQLTPYCERAHITRMRFDGDADTYITDLDALPDWSVESESAISDCDGIKYSFAVYVNSSPEPLPAAAGVSSSMAQYFKKKPDLSLDLIDCPDPAYQAELGELLTAYYSPIPEGFGADDVREYLKEGGMSFEEYLRAARYLAAPSDFIALAQKYDPDGRYPRCSVTVTRENYRDYL